MAWSWSHTEEAYVYAREQMEKLDRETRNVIAAEWLAAVPHPQYGIGFHANLDLRKYAKSLVRVAEWSDEKINKFIWDGVEGRDDLGMNKLRTCENGGWEAWCCPFGCGCHMVPFSSDEEEMEDLTI